MGITLASQWLATQRLTLRSSQMMQKRWNGRTRVICSTSSRRQGPYSSNTQPACYVDMVTTLDMLGAGIFSMTLGPTSGVETCCSLEHLAWQALKAA